MESSVGRASRRGFDRFGSSPAFRAFAIRKAWNLAYLILDASSGLTGLQIWFSSRKVAEAWKVSAVCLQWIESTFGGVSPGPSVPP